MRPGRGGARPWTDAPEVTDAVPSVLGSVGSVGSVKNVVLLDYGSGNLHSARRALARVGADVTVTADFETAMEADGLVVPGVGAFASCMAGLRADRPVPQSAARLRAFVDGYG